jgi:F-type H+-transporting ATPase subunit b
MPQLDVGTFPSQIFWILIGFLAIYMFVSRVVTPSIEETFENRISHIDSLVNTATQLKIEAKKLENESFIALENAEIDSSSAESKLLTSFREQSIKEKNMLFEMFSRKSIKESMKLSESVDRVFNEISGNIDNIMDAAMKSVSCSIKDDDRGGSA